MAKPDLRLADAFALLILTVASIIGINQYIYGVYNHCITIPFIKSAMNPALYPHDYLVTEKQFFYTYFLSFCGFLVQTLKTSLPVTFFILYTLSLYATLAAVFLIAMRLFQKKEVAYLSVMIVIFSFTTLGMERTVENLLMERTLVLPLLLFSFYAFLSKSYNLSALLAGIAFLIHPLSACYVLASLIMCFIYQLLKDRKVPQFVMGIALILVVMSPILILKFKNPVPGMGLFHVDKAWLHLLHLRSAHHIFPSTWSKAELLEGVAFIIGFVLTWRCRPKAEYHSVVLITFIVVLLMFLIGTIFTEIIPISIVIQFQLFRSFKFIFFFAIIYFANFIYTAPNTPSGVAQKILVSGLILAPYFHESATVAAGVTLVLMSAWAGWTLLDRINPTWKKYFIPAQLIMLLLLGIAGSLHKVHFSIQNAQDKQWLSVQRWAKDNTPIDAAFIVPPIVPPQFEGFRVESERTVYGEWKDGTQMFFNPAFGQEWIRRMEKLGYAEGSPLKDNYEHLSHNNFQQLAAEMAEEHSKVFAVFPHEMTTLDFPVVFSNEKFNVVEVSPTVNEHVAQIKE